jgi:hypothetical protein
VALAGNAPKKGEAAHMEHPPDSAGVSLGAGRDGRASTTDGSHPVG